MSWSAVWDAPRPFLHPVRTPAGALLTVEAPADHPWHHALWFAIKFVNGENFWEEYGEFGTARAPARSSSSPGGGVRATIDWVRPDGATRRAHRDPHAHAGRARRRRVRDRLDRGARARRPTPCSTARRSPPGAGTAA